MSAQVELLIRQAARREDLVLEREQWSRADRPAEAESPVTP